MQNAKNTEEDKAIAAIAHTTEGTYCSNDAPLRCAISSSGMLEVHSVLPDGIKVGSGAFGRCLLATKFKAKDERLYRSYCTLVQHTSSDPNRSSCTDSEMEHNSCKYLLHLTNHEGAVIQSFMLDDLNSVRQPTGNHRQVYGL
jgi:hypothetical protein